MRRAMVTSVVAFPLAMFAGCFSNGSQGLSPDGGDGINVNPDSSVTPPTDASPADATYADSPLDSAMDSAVDSPTDAADACEGACAGFFATCAEVHTAMPAAADGPFTLYVGHDSTQNWAAYCADLSTTPKEYLPLVQTGASSNFSQYTASASTGGTNVVTAYTKVRIDPTTLVVDTSD
jgi:GON domain